MVALEGIAVVGSPGPSPIQPGLWHFQDESATAFLGIPFQPLTGAPSHSFPKSHITMPSESGKPFPESCQGWTNQAGDTTRRKGTGNAKSTQNRQELKKNHPFWNSLWCSQSQREQIPYWSAIFGNVTSGLFVLPHNDKGSSVLLSQHSLLPLQSGKISSCFRWHLDFGKEAIFGVIALIGIKLI